MEPNLINDGNSIVYKNLKLKLSNRYLTHIFRYQISANQIHNYIKHDDITVLDIGCSDVTFLKFWRRNFSEPKKANLIYTGIDVRDGLLDKILSDEILEPKDSFFIFNLLTESDIIPKALHNKKYDVIIMHEIIEHLPKEDSIRLMKKATNLVSDDGIIIISTPNQKKTKGQKRLNFPKHHIYEYEFVELSNILRIECSCDVIDSFGWNIYPKFTKKCNEANNLFNDYKRIYGEHLATVLTAAKFPDLSDGMTLICKK